MRILSLSASIPTLEITNAKIIEEIRNFNQDQPKELVERYQKQVSFLLKKAGSGTRYYRNRQKKETALSLIQKSIGTALAKANLTASDIGLLLYCGVGRGFLEPANAYFLALAEGMNCQCFDVSDACMSWVRALEIASSYLKEGKHKYIMIVNAEFTIFEHGNPELFSIRSPDQVQYTFPAYTIGEAATATIVTQSSQTWNFHYHSAPHLAPLCTIPLKGFREFCQKDRHIGLNGINSFTSFGGKLFKNAVKHQTRLIAKTVPQIDVPDMWFPHSAALAPSIEVAKILGIRQERLFVDVFPKYGNVVSASLPLAMHMAIKDKKLVRGDMVILCPASAGMVFAVVQFEY